MLQTIKLFVLLQLSKHYHRQYDKRVQSCYKARLAYGEYSVTAERLKQEMIQSLIKWNKVTLKLQEVLEES